jgi:peptidylprolyl isomerase
MVHREAEPEQVEMGVPVSPLEVARDYIGREGSFELDEPVGGPRRNRVLLVAAAFVVAAAVIIVLATRSNPKPDASTSAVAIAQQAANAKAVAAGCPASPTARANVLTFGAPASVIRPHTLYAATVMTTLGTFRIGMNSLSAPASLNNFLFLAEQGYFDCNTFFYVSSQGIDRTGDPTGTGVGQPGYSIRAERPAATADPNQQYPLGSVALANFGSLDGGGGQWFVIAGPLAEGLPNKYSLFGHVIKGLDVIEKINAAGTASGKPKVLQRILKVTIQTQKV